MVKTSSCVDGTVRKDVNEFSLFLIKQSQRR
jgi:hypothetical protein